MYKNLYTKRVRVRLYCCASDWVSVIPTYKPYHRELLYSLLWQDFISFMDFPLCSSCTDVLIFELNLVRDRPSIISKGPKLGETIK